MDLVDLEVALPDLPYEVMRKVTVPLDLRLTDLHLVLQAVMGWDNSHLYDFACGRKMRWADTAGYFGGEGDRSLKKSSLADILAEMGRNKFFVYTYDMGDSWEHVIKPSKSYVKIGEGSSFMLTLAVGSCPPDDSGGIPGFSHMLECLADPASDGAGTMSTGWGTKSGTPQRIYRILRRDWPRLPDGSTSDLRQSLPRLRRLH